MKKSYIIPALEIIVFSQENHIAFSAVFTTDGIEDYGEV